MYHTQRQGYAPIVTLVVVIVCAHCIVRGYAPSCAFILYMSFCKQRVQSVSNLDDLSQMPLAVEATGLAMGATEQQKAKHACDAFSLMTTC